jgi:hypothetical protein
MHGKEFRVVFSSGEWFGTEFRECASSVFWFHGTEFRVVFSFAEGFGTELWDFASIFVPRNGIPSYFLFRGRVRNGIPRFSVPRNSRNSVGNNHLFRLFRLPRNYFFFRKFPTLVVCNHFKFGKKIKFAALYWKGRDSICFC